MNAMNELVEIYRTLLTQYGAASDIRLAPNWNAGKVEFWIDIDDGRYCDDFPFQGADAYRAHGFIHITQA